MAGGNFDTGSFLGSKVQIIQTQRSAVLCWNFGVLKSKIIKITIY